MFRISEKDLHPHLIKRMEERGIRLEEIEKTLNEGEPTSKAKEGTFGRTYVFSFNDYWEGNYYKKKEVTVYYKIKDKKLILLTVIARYGDAFI